MKKIFVFSSIFIASLAFLLMSCAQEDPVEPCDGKGTLNVENKLDSLITVKVVETHTTVNIMKDNIHPFQLLGNQPYTLNIDGPQYHKDTTIMLLSCDNIMLIVIK